MTKRDGARTYKQIGERVSNEAIRSRTFVQKTANETEISPKRIFWIARWPGDQIEGRLVGGPIINPRRNSSYVLEVDADHPLVQGRGTRDVEFWGNKLLHRILRENEAHGKRIRIEYVGSRAIPGYTRNQKVYRVFLVEEGIDRKEARIQ